MVTFNCEVCNGTVPKKQTEKHYYRCPDAYYTCIDCNKTFDDGEGYKTHTQCISEDEKYQKALYKNKKNKPARAVQEKKMPETKPAPEKSKQKSKPQPLTILKPGQNLYKILKSINSKDDKKSLLKRLYVTADGQLELKN